MRLLFAACCCPKVKRVGAHGTHTPYTLPPPKKTAPTFLPSPRRPERPPSNNPCRQPPRRAGTPGARVNTFPSLLVLEIHPSMSASEREESARRRVGCAPSHGGGGIPIARPSAQDESPLGPPGGHWANPGLHPGRRLDPPTSSRRHRHWPAGLQWCRRLP